MEWLNYHHLFYFWRIAREGGLSRAAEQLRLTHSTLSAQLRALEEFLGGSLFERRGRRLVLTPLGEEVASYADDIFRLGGELVDVARGRSSEKKRSWPGRIAWIACWRSSPPAASTWSCPTARRPNRARSASELRVQIAGEFDDAGLMRVAGAHGQGLFPVRAALRAEVEDTHAVELVGAFDGLVERYYVLSLERRVRHPAVSALVEQARVSLADTSSSRTTAKRGPRPSPKRSGRNQAANGRS